MSYYCINSKLYRDMSYTYQLMSQYKLTHVVVYTYSSDDINAVMP